MPTIRSPWGETLNLDKMCDGHLERFAMNIDDYGDMLLAEKVLKFRNNRMKKKPFHCGYASCCGR
ncbi:hypothetical protein [Streptomyces sp. NPDC126503]|uniref:hypothetical protein n=1 Tax=Streptomyces sp. NPDC126503 TaxID=3155315 RepID=UPI00331B94CC